MTSHPKILFLIFLRIFIPLGTVFSVPVSSAMVVTAERQATRAAVEILRKGGNAVDAAIAAQWVLNVVEPQSSGLGGGGFFLYYEAATKRIYAFDGREAAPAKAYPEMFLDKNGEPYPFNPDRITGGLPVGVPGTLRLLHHIHSRFASKNFSFAELFNHAIEIAENGFPVSKRLAGFVDEEKERLKLFEASRQIFFDAEGKPLQEGTYLFQYDLARTFRLIQREGIATFYEGKIAEAIVKAVQNAPFHPGLMKKEDLFYYRVLERNPITGSYRGYDIFSMGPPSSGGTTLIEALGILERYQLKLHGREPDGFHLLSEAQKLAFQDRNRYLGDPAFTYVPLPRLLSKSFASKRSDEIRFETAIPTTEAAVRPLALENPHTSHLSIIDKQGNMVAFTTTIEHVFGSAMVVAGYGFVLNNELTDFEAVPRNENKRLVANAAQGEKRPRSSMTPTFVFKKGRPFLILGSPGGSKIIGAVLNVIVNIIDFGMSLENALSAPRIINRGGAIELEPQLYENTYLKRELERRGHPVVLSPVIGNVQAIHFDFETDTIIGLSDPRGNGEALGN